MSELQQTDFRYLLCLLLPPLPSPLWFPMHMPEPQTRVQWNGRGKCATVRIFKTQDRAGGRVGIGDKKPSWKADFTASHSSSFTRLLSSLLRRHAGVSVYLEARNTSFKELSRENHWFYIKWSPSRWESWVEFPHQIQEVKLLACCDLEACLNHKATGI